MKKNITLIHHLTDILYLLLGTFLAGVGVGLFYTPASVTSGGASGIGNILYHLFGFDVGLVSFLVNVPLVLIGMKIFGIKYGIKTLLGAGLMSLWISLITHFTNYQSPLDVTQPINVLLSAIFGGMLLGSGIGLTMKSGCNTGGTDIIAQSIGHYSPIPIGNISLCVNLIIVTSSGFFIGFQPMLFSFIAMFCSSFMVNHVLTGFGTKMAKSVYIISDNIDKISDRVIKEIHRTGTVLRCEGAYTTTEHKMLLVLVQNHQYQRFLRIINEEDPKAFVFVNEAYSVLGKGFVPLEKIADQTTVED